MVMVGNREGCMLKVESKYTVVLIDEEILWLK